MEWIPAVILVGLLAVLVRAAYRLRSIARATKAAPLILPTGLDGSGAVGSDFGSGAPFEAGCHGHHGGGDCGGSHH